MTTKRKGPGTQRAWRTLPRGILHQHEAEAEVCVGLGASHHEPVLVVPEAAVKGCGHKKGHTMPGGYSDWCSECGAIGIYTVGGRVRWQRPRILRPAKERTR